MTRPDQLRLQLPVLPAMLRGWDPGTGDGSITPVIRDWWCPSRCHPPAPALAAPLAAPPAAARVITTSRAIYRQRGAWREGEAGSGLQGRVPGQSGCCQTHRVGAGTANLRRGAWASQSKVRKVGAHMGPEKVLENPPGPYERFLILPPQKVLELGRSCS